jgi:putative ABC transport system ATP-binding protein
MNDWVIELEDIRKIYRMGEVDVNALAGLTLRVERGAVLTIMGPSGSGKSTLMNVIGCLDRPTSGTYRLDGKTVSQLSDDALAEIRNRKVGFVFQSFNLLGRSTATANVELPLRYAGINSGRRERAKEVLQLVGLGDRLDHRPMELSGGQQQRVAIARAMVNNPAIILADEPTGNLDSRSGAEILELLLGLNRDRGTTLVIVTHDASVAKRAGRIVRLKDGCIEEDYVPDAKPA